MPEKKKEPNKEMAEELRKLDDDEFATYQDSYPSNVYVIAEAKRRENKKIKERDTTIVGH